MTIERMDLKAAAELLGITPNAVRARAKKAKPPVTRWETDNQNKIIVWIDMDKAAVERAAIEPSTDDVETFNEGFNETFKEPDFEGENLALKAHVETLHAFNKTLQTHLDQTEADNRQLREREQEWMGRVLKTEAEAGRVREENATLLAEIRFTSQALAEYQARIAANASKPGLLSRIAGKLKRSS